MPRRQGWRGAQFPGDFPSLGWEVEQWIEDMLLVPLGPFAGQRFRFDGWQHEQLVRFYGVDPRTGRFAYRRAMLELAKGMGKSPWAGAIAWAELLAPTVFDGWDADGEPVGRPRPTPWIQVAATAFDQTDNTWLQLLAMGGEKAPLHSHYDVEPGQTKVQLRESFGLIEPVTSKSGTRIGQPLTFGVMEETWVWKPHNGGPELARTIRDNLRKNGGRSIELSNAYGPGEESVAEATAKAAESPRSRILVYSVEGPEVKDPKDPDELLPALRVVYRDAPWVDLELMVEDCMADDVTALNIRRMHLNHHLAAESRLVLDEVLDLVLDPNFVLEDGAPIAVGFDGSKTRDGTAVVGVHMVSGVAFLVRHWERPPFAGREWEVPRGQVMDVLAETFERWDVVRMKADKAYWGDEVAQLQNRYGKDVVDRFPTSTASVVDESISTVQTNLEQAARVNREAAERDEAPPRLLVDGTSASAPLVAALRAAQLAQLAFGSRTYRKLVKPEDGRKIDCAAAYTYAEQARREALTRGWAPAEAAPEIW